MGLRTRMQAVPANFGNGIRLHPSSHCRRQQLAAEADAEHGLLRIHRLADDLDFGLEVRELPRLVDIHWSAEHDEAVIPANVRLRVGLAAEIHVADAESGRTQQRIEVTERFGGDVLEDEQFRHVRALCFEGRRTGLQRPFWRQCGGALNASCDAASRNLPKVGPPSQG